MGGPTTARGVNVEAVRTFDEAATHYDTSGAQFVRPIAARLVALACLRPGQRVLDVGCGAGAVLIPAAEAVSPSGVVTGIDLSARMLKRARAAADAHGLANTHVRLGNAADPPFGPGSFDAVLSSLVVYLLLDPAAALARWRQLLTPGGTLGFSWGVGPDPRWLPVFAAVDRYAPAADGFESHVRRLGSPADMEAVLRRCGCTRSAVTAETVTVRYHNPEQWWQASWHELPRLTWRHIPANQRERAKREAFQLLGHMQEPDGSLTRQVRIAYAVAWGG